MSERVPFVTHHGQCHCGAVKFSVKAPEELVCFDCDCSICHMKRNTHFIVPASQFQLESGADSLTLYTFNTHKAKHRFCNVCGVQAFYTPRSNQDGIAITVYCITSKTIKNYTVEKFHGIEWEKSYADMQSELHSLYPK